MPLWTLRNSCLVTQPGGYDDEPGVSADAGGAVSTTVGTASATAVTMIARIFFIAFSFMISVNPDPLLLDEAVRLAPKRGVRHVGDVSTQPVTGWVGSGISSGVAVVG